MRSDLRKLREREAYLAEAMRKAQEGDSSAYRELLLGARALVEAYSMRILTRMGLGGAERAEDLAQEILLALHEKRHTYDPSQPLTPWLLAIARYKAIDYGRRCLPERGNIALEEALEQDPSIASVFSDPGEGLASDLAALLVRLPERSRRALELVKLEGLSVAEAAASPQMSESAIKVTVHRAIQRLRKALKREEARR